MNRRTTLRLGIAGVFGIAAGRARAETAGSQRGRTGSTSKGKGQSKPNDAAAAPKFLDLKTVGAQGQVQAIHGYGRAFEVRTVDGQSRRFQQPDLRFKIDSSELGPSPNRPVILPGGMMGDRATVFFASPEEIGALIKPAVQA